MEGVLLDQEHRQPLRAVELLDRAEDLFDDQRREAERGLVEQQQLGPATSARGRSPASAARRPTACRRAAARAPSGAGTACRRGEVLVEMREIVDRGAHLQVFVDRHAREDAPPLRRLRDRHARDDVRRQRRDVLAGEGDGARAGSAAMPKIVIIVVDLPAPLAPISVTISPSLTSMSTPFSAWILP